MLIVPTCDVVFFAIITAVSFGIFPAVSVGISIARLHTKDQPGEVSCTNAPEISQLTNHFSEMLSRCTARPSVKRPPIAIIYLISACSFHIIGQGGPVIAKSKDHVRINVDIAVPENRRSQNHYR